MSGFTPTAQGKVSFGLLTAEAAGAPSDRLDQLAMEDLLSVR